ncbi:uncharacterized protein N7498_009608 [Penicillium cinerascens]|uniref:Peptidase A1 domain-containing protein n=1 Tax=Penicillium cinerascens TaxID=70096 RepID=A0A9W9J5U4_9EURO|nr:uncharacterized protein N7498_009608 [Penicillium cinerascens]KAJ5190623.1 hypothetical protein N7498_009608 [Penicillium cinerascens]
MRSGVSWLFALAGAALVNGFSSESRDAPAVVAVPFRHDRPVPNQLLKRSKIADIATDFQWDVYNVNITLGTPPQSLIAIFSTWGNGCWVTGVNSSDCSVFTDTTTCGGDGAYNRTLSTSAKLLDEKFSYDDSSSQLTGEFVTDVLTIGDAKVNDMKMGVAEWGFPSNTISLGYGNTSSTSFTQALADSGAINSPAFSMWSNMILFGGINKAKYEEPLYTFPIVNGSDLTKALRINMTGISVNETAMVSDKFPLDAVFDIEVDMTYVPDYLAKALFAQIGATGVPDDNGQVNLSCSSVGENATIGFNFGDLNVQLPAWSFLSGNPDIGESDYETDDLCYFTICENKELQNEGSIVLGTNFITLVYSVFDLENDEISLAGRNWNAASDDIVEITTGKNAVPGTTAGSNSTGSNSTGTKSAGKKSAGIRIEVGMRAGALISAIALWCFVL